MTITIESSIESSLTLQDYVDYVESCVDLTDEDSILASAPYLKALANNRQFLLERFNQELRNWAEFQPDNKYSAQTLLLAQRPRFAVRANMWAPRTGRPDDAEWESQIFAYNLPHDHNYSFLTVGYFGPGYMTSIHEYDPDRTYGYPGERVDIRFLETTRLHTGKLMYYRASRDIHSQEPPEQFSISLNLLTMSVTAKSRSQYWFDLEAGAIKDFVQQSANTGRLMLCRLARFIGNDTTAAALEKLAKMHSLGRVRAAAYRSLAYLEKDHADSVWRDALNDPDALVRHIARTALNTGTDNPGAGKV